MNLWIFLLCIALCFAGLFCWSFSVLPKERWQILASVPWLKQSNGEWLGVNITFYGFFIAVACVVASAFVVLMLGAIHIRVGSSLMLIACILGLCLPSARVMARSIENKPFSFTSNGALFTGLLSAPLVIAGANRIFEALSMKPVPALPMLAAASVAFAYGEGLGRLACISFGCCYGKRVDQLSPALRRLLEPIRFIFWGETKKVAYEGRMEGVPVVPIQALTSVFSVLAAMIGTWLFFKSYFGPSLVVTIGATQLWRIASEFLRADYRGEGRFTAYQFMSLAMIIYVVGAVFVLPVQTDALPDLGAGFNALWNPGLLVFLQILWLIVFIYNGRSSVTSSTVSIHIHWNRI